jgi:hypothetical protein
LIPTGTSPVHRVRRCQHADIAHAVDEDAVTVHQAVHAPDEVLVLHQDLREPLQPARRQVIGQPADTAIGIGHARAGCVGQVLVDVVANGDQVQECGHRAEFHQRGRHAGQVVGQARILGHQRADIAAARRDLDSHQGLDGLAVGEVVDQRGAVIEPVDVGNQVMPGVRFALLLESPVKVAAMHVGAHDPLAVELGDDLDRAVRRRMRRADVDDHVAFVGRFREGRADRVG